MTIKWRNTRQRENVEMFLYREIESFVIFREKGLRRKKENDQVSS